MHVLRTGLAAMLLLLPGALAAQEKAAPENTAPKGNWACPPNVINPGCADQALGRPVGTDPQTGNAPGGTDRPAASSVRESRDIGAPDAAKDVGKPGDREPPAFGASGGKAGGSGSAKE
ncbi:MAG TPA: hypothetical protein VD995_22670 [Azospirillum sp.]|nr:hypothetical protein [Azospirillum sp.]